jgi:hypothetical protein
MLKPGLGHPNSSSQLNDLNKQELERQSFYFKEIKKFLSIYRKELRQKYGALFKSLSNTNTELLIKFDDILVADEVRKHGEYFKFYFIAIETWRKMS